MPTQPNPESNRPGKACVLPDSAPQTLGCSFIASRVSYNSIMWGYTTFLRLVILLVYLTSLSQETAACREHHQVLEPANELPHLQTTSILFLLERSKPNRLISVSYKEARGYWGHR